MNRIRKLWAKLSRSKEYRHSYLQASVHDSISAQIFALRTHRGWTQSDLAMEAGMKQSRISKLEADSVGVSTTTLCRLARAFDVGLKISFIPFHEVARESIGERVDRPVISFAQDIPPEGTFFRIEKIITAADKPISAMRLTPQSGPSIGASQVTSRSWAKANQFHKFAEYGQSFNG